MRNSVSEVKAITKNYKGEISLKRDNVDDSYCAVPEADSPIRG